MADSLPDMCGLATAAFGNAMETKIFLFLLRKDVFLLVLIVFGVGVWMCGKRDSKARHERVEQLTRDLNDLSIPPVLNDAIRDPNWKIANRFRPDEKGSSCAKADEYMDQNAIGEVITLRGRRGSMRRITHHLSDYVEACRNRIKVELESFEPHVRKWCAYRKTDPRLETLCREWEENRDAYIARMQAMDEPTLARYERFIGGDTQQ